MLFWLKWGWLMISDHLYKLIQWKCMAFLGKDKLNVKMTVLNFITHRGRLLKIVLMGALWNFPLQWFLHLIIIWFFEKLLTFLANVFHISVVVYWILGSIWKFDWVIWIISKNFPLLSINVCKCRWCCQLPKYAVEHYGQS